MSDDGDAALVLRARGGDKDALAMLLARHRPLLVALCRRALGDAASAEDAAQEASLQAMLNLAGLRRPDRFGPWLAGIGLNVCRRMARERSRTAWSWDELCGGRFLGLPDPQPGPEALAEEQELAERIHHAVAALPDGQRAAVALFYLLGLTLAETAETLGVPTGAVKTRLHKARATLRRRLVIAWIDERPRAGTEDQMTQATSYVEMRVADLSRSSAESGEVPRYVVMLEDEEGAHRLPIWVGQFEGMAIALHLEGIQAPRPMTFAFAANLLEASGARLREVRIDRLSETVFYATAVVESPDGPRDMDARPSDAINLALLTGAPIRVAREVLDAVAAQPSSWPDADRPGAVGAAEIVAQFMETWPGRQRGAPPAP